jgi:hypothetical protein
MAFFKGSAYEFTPIFDYPDSVEDGFRGLRGRRQRKPELVLEHTVAVKERLDSLGHEYFAQSRDWRWLVEANSDVIFPEDLLWDTQGATYDKDGKLVDPGTQDDNGRERVGHVIIIPRRAEAR